MMRGLAVVTALSLAGCPPNAPTEDWTCDFYAHESRPLAERDASADDTGALPAAACQATCGPPATSCTATTLDGGVPGAVCPVCTF